MTDDLTARFEAKYEVDAGGCWLWTANLDTSGYGRFWFEGRTVSAHRFSYEQLIGPIPEGLDIDHLCRVRHCVNPEHMEPVTRQVNGLRGVGPQAVHAAQTHCIRGHELAGDNLIIVEYTGRPARSCRACRQENHLERYQPAPKWSVLDRFLSKVRLDVPTGCWEWTASHRGAAGQFSMEPGVTLDAHRVAWMLLRARELQPSEDLVRTCATARCVNPEHHRPVPAGATRGRRAA